MVLRFPLKKTAMIGTKNLTSTLISTLPSSGLLRGRLCLLSNSWSPSFRTVLQNAMIMNLRKSHKGENASSSEQEITNQIIASVMAGSIEW